MVNYLGKLVKIIDKKHINYLVITTSKRVKDYFTCYYNITQIYDIVCTLLAKTFIHEYMFSYFNFSSHINHIFKEKFKYFLKGRIFKEKKQMFFI